MAPGWLSILILGVLGLQATCFVFDSEEIKSLNFVVDILDQPVLLSEAPEEERSVQMYNRAGQAYSCLLPDTEPLLQQHREETEASQHASVPSLLAPMSSGPCLQRTRDWWTYELCPMSEIRQYHMEGGQIMGKVSVLGRFESDYDWSQDDGRSRNAKQRYHSQTYVNGSDCDLTGRPRSAEVRYVCEEGGGDVLTRVDEPETCRYVLTVRTARLCGHRALAPPPGLRPQPVTCRPALSADQMRRLAEARLERTRKEAERAVRRAAERQSREREREQEWDRELEREQEQERKEAGREEQEEEREGREEEEARRVKKKLREKMALRVSFSEKRLAYLKKTKDLFDGIISQTKKLGNVLDGVIHSYINIVSELNTETEYGVERLHMLRKRHLTAQNHHAAQAMRIQALFELAEEGHYHIGQIVRDLIAYVSTQNIFAEVMIGISEESRRLKEFMYVDPSAVTDNTLGQLMKTIANLSSLSKELKRFFAETEAWQAELLASMTEVAELDGSEDTPPGHTGPGAERDPDTADPDSTEALDLLKSRPVRSGDERPSSEDPEEDVFSEDDGGDGDEESSSDSSKKGRVKFTTLRSLDLDKMVQISEIDREQRARIERTVKQKLGKVGLDSNGPEIKVRFLKFPDLDHLDKEHTLSEEELAAFEKALIAVMMGDNEALVEHEKHSEQAKNYEYNFDQAVQSLEAEQEEERADESPAIDESLFTLV